MSVARVPHEVGIMGSCRNTRYGERGRRGEIRHQGIVASAATEDTEEVSQMSGSRLGSRSGSATKEFLTGNQFASCYIYFLLDTASGTGWIWFI